MYKTKLQPTIAQSLTEVEFMGASDFGKILLYVRSVLWDLGGATICGFGHV